MTFKLPDLPYPYDALEPYIDVQTMKVHYDQHHQKYTDKLNEALARHPEIKESDINVILGDLSLIPTDIRTAVRNNGGGYANHNFFWTIMSSDGSSATGESAEAIKEAFGSIASFREQFLNSAASLFGSGWTWLVVANGGELEIMNTANQDSPISIGATPILTVDLWEHAYYIRYQNRRPEYLENWWKVINWEEVERRYLATK